MAVSLGDPVRAGLSQIVKHGPSAVWLPQVQPLMDLPVVRANLEEKGEDGAADALREALVEAVSQLGPSQYRRLLTVMLRLDADHAARSLGERREIAGREFRGGRDPVAAGTIRQHHEPRALDELTAVLLRLRPASLAEDDSAERQPAQSIQWHPAIREAWAGEQLYFWRLSVAIYDRERVLERVRTAMRRTRSGAWQLYEMLGAHDVMIKAWLPTTQTVAEEAIHDVFRTAGEQIDVDCFHATEILREWPWVGPDGRMRSPSPEVVGRRLPGPEIAAIDAGDVARYERDGIVTLVPQGRGIEFFVVVGPSRHAVVRPVAPEVRTRVLDVVQAASSGGLFSELSLYRGMGFGPYLLHGRVRHDSFHRLESDLLMPLNDAVRALGCRTAASVMSTEHPLCHEERLDSDALGAPPRSAREWLSLGEGQRLEVRGSAFSNLREQFADPGKSSSMRPESATIRALLRAITGFLNSDGGTIVIGAMDAAMYRRYLRYRAEQGTSEDPKVGDYFVTGLEQELTTPPDIFEQNLRERCRSGVSPDPNGLVRIVFDTVAGRQVCVVTVRAPDRGERPWFYYVPRAGEAVFWVRSGRETRKLVGVEADLYRRAAGEGDGDGALVSSVAASGRP